MFRLPVSICLYSQVYSKASGTTHLKFQWILDSSPSWSWSKV